MTIATGREEEFRTTTILEQFILRLRYERKGGTRVKVAREEGCHDLVAPIRNTVPLLVIITSVHVPYPDVVTSCLSGETHLRPCAHSLATDIGTISSWMSGAVSAALTGGVRDRLFARRPSDCYRGECCNRILTLGDFVW